jgi:TonB family protein
MGAAAFAAETVAPPHNGLKVVLNLSISEAGTVEDAQVASSEDPSMEHVLDQLAMETARGLKLPPRIKEGHAVKYTAQAPYVFPIDFDEGAAANTAPRPKIHSAVQPVYPAEMAAKGEVGGAILEAVIGTDGKVKTLKALSSSGPAFEQSALTAVNQWIFVPALKDNLPVESRWRLAISFGTDTQLADWKWRVAPRPALGSYTVVHRTKTDQPVPVGTVPAAPAAPAEKK